MKNLTILLALWLLIFAAARLSLLALFPQQFAGLSLAQTPELMLLALPFDLKVIAWLLTPVLLIVYLPLPLAWLQGIWWRALRLLLSLVAALALFASLCVLVANLRFYADTRNHLGVDILSLGAEYGLIGRMLLQGLALYLPLIVLALGLAALGGYCLYRSRAPQSWRKRVGFWCLLFVCLTVAARGGFDLRPLGPANAYAHGKQRGDFIVNPIMTVGQNLIKARARARLAYNNSEITELSQRWLQAPPSTALQRKYTRLLPDQPNIVVIVVESLSWQYLDGLSGADFGVTPTLDQLSAQALVYPEFYASGARSIDSVQPLLFGLPTFPELPTLLTGIEQKSLVGLGEYARRAGYRSILSQSFPRNSFYLDAHAARAGFEFYFAQEDTPPELDYLSKATPYGGYDYEHLQRLCAQISALGDQPVLSVAFTGRTHVPYLPTLPQFATYPEDSAEHQFLNALHYTDWALERFLACARAQGWYQRSLFIVTSDHSRTQQNTRIPLLLYAPNYPDALSFPDRPADNLGLFASLVHLLGYEQSFNSFAPSLFTAEREDLLWRRSPPLVLVQSAGGELSINATGAIGYNRGLASDQASAAQAHYLALRWLVERNSY